MNTNIKRHPFHIVDPSPWPFLGSISALGLTLGAVLYFHGFNKGELLLFSSFIHLLLVCYGWWRDVIDEATFQGCHTKKVQRGLRIGMILFIVSEAMFFFSLFWAFFHSSLAPVVEIACAWPPYGIRPLHTWGLPLTNTFTLLASAASITLSHRALMLHKYKQAKHSLVVTIELAICFTIFQYTEYIESEFCINDAVYGSVFFLLTGFHGLHVIIGTIFLFICYLRHCECHFTARRHLGFEMAIWYWHFVDVVWIFVFVFVYWWGNTIPFNIMKMDDFLYYATNPYSNFYKERLMTCPKCHTRFVHKTWGVS